MPEKKEVTLGGHTIELSNLDKVLFPKDGITKGDVIKYYEAIAPKMLPHIHHRALSLNRYPDGIEGESWFQKNTPDYFPDWIKTVSISKEDGTNNFTVCEKPADLVYLANQAAITLHGWLSRYDKPKNPDLLIFDLDPSADDFEPVREVAFTLQKILTDLGLTPYVKTTGSRGVHVCCPLDRTATFDESHIFAHDVAMLIVKQDPKMLTVEMSKEKRRGRVFVDALRNSYAQTAVVPYSIRAKNGAPVAAPITWRRLGESKLGPQSYNINNILRQGTDPWADIFSHAASLTRPRQRLDEMMKEEPGKARSKSAAG